MTNKKLLKPMKIHDASYRDPSGFLYERDSVLYRQVNQSYKENLDLFFSSGLYDSLVHKNFLVPSQIVDIEHALSDDAYAVLQPERIPFISYPYEWCFDQLKDAALLTLRIERTALSYGMTLKDASAFNIQFRNSQPIFIDTLSFEKYSEGSPWVAYRQFIEHFFGPLLIMRYVDERVALLHRVSSNGIPLDVIRRLLPKRTLLNVSVLLHIHFQTAIKHATETRVKKQTSHTMSKQKLDNLISHLEDSILKLCPPKRRSVWGTYYSDTNYDKESFKEKSEVVVQMVRDLQPHTLWDIGANNGHFTKQCAELVSEIYAFDVDYAAINDYYIYTRKHPEEHTLPLVMDITNPSPSLGYAHTERDSLIERANADTVLALALIHHLTIFYAIPFDKVAAFLRSLADTLIIEFPHPDDSQVLRLLQQKHHGIHTYSQELFEQTFSLLFSIQKKQKLKTAKRTLYEMKAV